MKNWWYNPFNYIAGAKSLMIGLAVMIIATWLGYLNNVHFDGTFDIHISERAPLAFHFIESTLSWLIPVILFYVGGLILSSSKVRFIDVLGTLSFARIPLLIPALLGFLPAFQDIAKINPQMLANPQELLPMLPGLIIVSITSIITIVWVIALMFNAYKVSCNLKEVKLILSFILILILSEIASKLLLIYIFKQYFS